MLPFIIGAGIGAGLSLLHISKEAEKERGDAKAIDDVEKRFRKGRYEVQHGLLDDDEDTDTSQEADSEIPEWLFELADMDDDNTITFLFRRDEDDFKPGYYKTANNGVYAFGDEKFHQDEKKVIKYCLAEETYEVIDIGRGRSIRIIDILEDE